VTGEAEFVPRGDRRSGAGDRMRVAKRRSPRRCLDMAARHWSTGKAVI
jgi:hypothetical protein